MYNSPLPTDSRYRSTALHHQRTSGKPVASCCYHKRITVTLFGISLVLATGDPITISGNTIGDLVNVNVNVTANIQNEINQDYLNVLGLLLSSTGDVELFRKLGKAMEKADSTTTSPNAIGNADSSQQTEDINIEEALKKLFPHLMKKQ
uniref:Uncharacterized protein n=1 Tax=Anopheles culicifacies TaxID=139723 RepID=A0A182LZY9_9DIPT